MNRMHRFTLVLTMTCGLGCDTEPGTAEPLEGEPAIVGGCETGDHPPGFAACVDAFAPVDPASFGHDAMPDIVLGPPRPATAGGSTDVASLGCGGVVTLGFPDGVPDGPGPDLVVFENAFEFADGTFVEPAEIRVSDDGETWFAFPCDAASTEGCAGVTPTDPGAAMTPRAPDLAGGDAFDLADLGLSRIHWVRLVDRTREHYGDGMWCVGAGAGFDLDAVAQVHER